MSEKLKTHKDLEVWKQSMGLVDMVYLMTRSFPKEEIYGLTSQIRRAAVSIPSNIAEGAARRSSKEFIQFLHVALGSVSEVETQAIIAQRLNYADDTSSIDEQIEKVRKLILGLVRYLKRKDAKE